MRGLQVNCSCNDRLSAPVLPAVHSHLVLFHRKQLSEIEIAGQCDARATALRFVGCGSREIAVSSSSSSKQQQQPQSQRNEEQVSKELRYSAELAPGPSKSPMCVRVVRTLLLDGVETGVNEVVKFQSLIVVPVERTGCGGVQRRGGEGHGAGRTGGGRIVGGEGAKVKRIILNERRREQKRGRGAEQKSANGAWSCVSCIVSHWHGQRAIGHQRCTALLPNPPPSQ